MGSGGAQSNISKENIVGYCFPLAPYAEQIRVVVDIDQEDDLSEWYELFNIAVEGV